MMRIRHSTMCCVLTGMSVFAAAAPLAAQQSKPATAGSVSTESKAQAVLDRAAKEGKYTCILFYKVDDAATRSMADVLKNGLKSKAEQATVAYVQVSNPAEKPLVDKYDLSRAPMPITLVIAPNGAMTGIFAQKLATESLDDAFVTPTMMRAMKSLQEGKLVLITMQGTTAVTIPVAIKDFQADPHFKDRLVSISMKTADTQEAKFVSKLELNPKEEATHTVLLAPPGVVVGKFAASASMNEIAAALAKAGKCCDDPNCKHHQSTPPSAAQSTPTRR